MTKQFKNKSGETIDCEEIATCYPSETWWALNKKQRQEAADKNKHNSLC